MRNENTLGARHENLKTQFAVLLLCAVCLLTGASGQLTPTGDAYTNTAAMTTNYGAKTLLDVESTQTSFIQFNLSSIPSGYTSADVTKATLKLYVNAVTTAGSFNVDYVNGTWTESTIDASNAPALGATIAASVPLITADKNQYILVDVTAAVQAWLSGTANDGIALVANSPLNASFDAKENTTTSHPAELDIVFAGGGTLTGITTASGSGLAGGGTSGTLNLSLTNACSANQVLQYNGSSWVCAAVGTGTVTSVGSGAGLTGGPITGSGTLSIAANACASGSALSALPFTCSPFATLGANTFTGNQTVSGNLSATGLVTGSGYQIGSNLFDYGSYANQNAFLGFSGNATMTGGQNTASGYQSLPNNVTGSYNTASGYQALCYNTTGAYNTALGEYALANNQTGGGNIGIGWDAGATIDGLAFSGSQNTALGYGTKFGTDSLSYATAIGTFAEVSESNAIVLGSFANSDVCQNGAVCSNTNVGIGTTAPTAALDVVGNSLQALIGDPVCGSGFAGVGFVNKGGFNSCSNYALLGDVPGNLYINSSLSGKIYFRNNNGTLMTIDTSGDVNIKGNLSKGGGSFKIDDPLDPANKYLYHSFVESPDMMNVYNGNITTNKAGLATVALPDYFEALNRDFRYQLTVIGQFAQAIVAKEVSKGRFTIKTNRPGVKVSWQVTGIRQDAYANAHRIPTEVEKPPQEQGHYLHPELFGVGPEQAVGYDGSQSPSAQLYRWSLCQLA